MKITELDYDLPKEAIAQVPADPRDSARLLVDPLLAFANTSHNFAAPIDMNVSQLPELIAPGDVVVVNDTKVMHARLNLYKESSGRAEVLLLEPKDLSTGTWKALVKPGRRLPEGTKLVSKKGTVVAVIEEILDAEGTRAVRLVGDPTDSSELPLPPYIHQKLKDESRYQTVYARREASVAAPTAGLHLTRAVLDEITSRGAEVVSVELVVGLGTFKPIVVDHVIDHKMHTERFEIEPTVAQTIKSAKSNGGRVVAIGTTVVRTLESMAKWDQLSGNSDLFITPGFNFQMVDVLLTNFHIPRSSLLCLLAAFMGSSWRDYYQVALDRKYRFLSFGDAMLVGRR